MKCLSVWLVLFCATICYSEVLGPDSKFKNKKSKDEEEPPDTLDMDPRIDAEYMKDIKKVANEQIQELTEYMSQLKDENEKKEKFQLLEDYKEFVGQADALDRDGFLEEIKDMTEKLSQMKPQFLDGIVEMPRNHLEILEDSPQLLLDQLQTSSPAEEEDLTPELKEAKAIYENALLKIKRRSSIQEAIMKINEAAEAGYVPAKIQIAWSYLFGEVVEPDVEKAKAVFTEYSEQGIADAHSGMGFLYSSGIGVPVSQAKALVHYTIGAIGDSTFSQMALAYRNWAGVTVTSSCPKAMDLYMKVAAKVASGVSLSGGPVIQRTRLMDEAEGTGSGTLDGDLIEYYQLLAEKGDVQAQVGLGQLHFQGGRGVSLDVNKALTYFTQAAKTGNAVANAFLGKIYLEGGDGIKADNKTALKYFQAAAALNNPVGQSGLGLMYLQGRGVPKDTTAAFKCFTMAANQGWVEGQLHLGFMYYGGIGVRRDLKQANKYFSLASQSGHVLAFYHLAHMHAHGIGVPPSCPTAVELLKNVCERGPWSAALMRAHAAVRTNNYRHAYLQYAALADTGHELAQSNAAYLLDSGEVTMFNETERYVRALQLWSRAASQGNSAARVKLGDYHYYGLGTKPDYEAAAHHYRIASEQQHNAQATFNLGYMHSHGLGLARDPHLAKRCYDLAADTSPDARLPAALALAALHVHQSPLALLFLTGESPLVSNWDVYLIASLVGSLGLVLYFRRPQPAQ